MLHSLEAGKEQQQKKNFHPKQAKVFRWTIFSLQQLWTANVCGSNPLPPICVLQEHPEVENFSLKEFREALHTILQEQELILTCNH